MAPRTRNQLTAIAIRNAPPGKLSDGAGLFLLKTQTGGRWIYRYQLHGRRRDMGLGTADAITLAQARAQRDEAEALVKQGRDPIAARDAQREAQLAALDRDEPTFAAAVEIAFERIQHGLRDGGERGRWLSPIRVHVLPKIGARRLPDLSVGDMLEVLRPIWREKHPTALKVVRRTRMILETTRRIAYPDADPKIVDDAVFRLGEHHHRTQHIASARWQDIPRIFSDLQAIGSVAARCNQMIILTAARGAPARGMQFDEIDGAVWTVPEARMKGTMASATDWRCPLSRPALRLIEEAREDHARLVFPGDTGKAPITSTAIEKCMHGIKDGGLPHGFRSSFKDWCRETAAADYEVHKLQLGHKVGDATERAYARSDLLDRRAILMQKWADYVTGEMGQVVELPGARA